MIVRSAKESLARFLLFKEGMDFKKGVACLMVAMLLGMTGTALAAPKFVALMFNKAQNSVAMRLEAVDGATNYKILRSETEGAGHAEIGVTPRPMFMDTDIEVGSTYYYIFIAVTPGGEVKSEEGSVTIPGAKKKKLPPPSITKVTPSVRSEMGKTTASVAILWSQERAAETMGFTLFRSETAGGPYNIISSPGPTDKDYVDNDIAVGKTYYYVMTALDMNMMETPYSAEAKAEVKAAEKEKPTKRVKRLRQPIPRTTHHLWTTWDDNEKTQKIEGITRVKLRNLNDITLDEKRGLLYVSVKHHNVVTVLKTSDGSLERYITTDGFQDPLGNCLDSDGNLYVVDSRNNAVYSFTPGGELRGKYPLEKKEDDKPLAPVDVAVGKDGRLYVTEQANNKIIIIDPASGTEVSRWGVEGLEEGQLKGVMYLETMKDGNLIIVNGQLGKADIFTPDGKYLSSVARKGADIEGLQFITGVHVADDGHVFLTDVGPALIKEFDPNGEDRQYVADLANDTGEGRLEIFGPQEVTVDSAGVIYITQGMANQVTAYKLGEVIAPE